ncbi:unnamed protein product [Bursaphelenchus xylophilus]|uniref:Prefoldin subunit 4 n=1 Tax=Bursaphelenchus xylophilus TaxID=6326 RepID=A0A1I7S344_BURXY|nr:unnamed protein product [Bursaphelenchus xylophilus]CAG9116090.1 unnamed protein product [Bursaphelenchus xylophilus]
MSKEYKKSVSPEDQAQINEFAREHKCLVDLKGEYKNLEKEKANYDDASDELLILDETDGPFAYKFGESFIYLEHDEVTEKLEVASSACEKRMEVYKTQIDQATKRRDQLKEQLRSKFGDNIGLDDDDDS